MQESALLTPGLRHTCTTPPTRLLTARAFFAAIMFPAPGPDGEPPAPTTAPSCSPQQLDALIELADRTKLRAYADYSKFRVGAALLAADGTMFSGCNVENSSYGLTMCAERVALFTAVAAGVNSFRAVVVYAGAVDGLVGRGRRGGRRWAGAGWGTVAEGRLGVGTVWNVGERREGLDWTTRRLLLGAFS